MTHIMLLIGEKSCIVGMHESGMKCMDIVVVLNVLWSTIIIILIKGKVYGGSVESLKSQCGRHQKMSNHGVRMLSQFITNNRRHPLLETSHFNN